MANGTFPEYTVRTHSDGELTQPLEYYSTLEEALERMSALVIVVDTNTCVDVFDESGYVHASEYIA